MHAVSHDRSWINFEHLLACAVTVRDILARYEVGETVGVGGAAPDPWRASDGSDLCAQHEPAMRNLLKPTACRVCGREKR